MNLEEICKKYEIDYNDDDHEMYAYGASFKVTPEVMYCTLIKSLKGEPVDELLKELILTLMGDRNGMDSYDTFDELYSGDLLIKDRAGFEEVLEVVSKYPYFDGLYGYWTRVNAFKKEDYVQPVPTQ